jgi:hypothetical protein
VIPTLYPAWQRQSISPERIGLFRGRCVRDSGRNDKALQNQLYPICTKTLTKCKQKKEFFLIFLLASTRKRVDLLDRLFWGGM